MNIYAKDGHKIVYTGASDMQVAFGGGDDPRGKLVEGNVYAVHETEIHSHHTNVIIRGIGGKYNSVLFEDYVGEELKTPEQWADEQGILILDTDGWRDKCFLYDAKDFREPITKKEYNDRVSISTIMSRPEAQECGDEIDIDELLKENSEMKEEIEDLKTVVDNFTGLITSMTKSKHTCMMCNYMEREVCLDQKDELRDRIAELEFSNKHNKKIIVEMRKLLDAHVDGWSSALDNDGVHVD